MLDRTIAPPFVRDVSFELIKPDVHSLPNGVETYFISGGSQNVLKVELIFRAGRWYEGKATAAHFTAQLLSKGTRNKSSYEIATIFDQYGAHLEVNAGLDFVSVSVYVLNKTLDRVLPLLMEILTEPAFPQREFDQSKSVFIQNLQVSNEKTSYVASQIFRRNLFGKDHPYGIVVEERHPAQLSISDFKKHFESFFLSPKVFVSGRFSEGEKQLLLKHLEAFRSGQPASVATHSVKAGPTQERVEKKESVQSSIRVGKPSLLRSHEDYVGVLFVSHILGGYFGSRLMKNIREEKGLTYGISASIHGLKHGSYLIIGADVNKENTNLTFDEIQKELKTLRSILITAEELETSRNHFIGSLQSEITTPFAHADKIKTIVLHDLSTDHYRNMIRKIDAITPQQIIDISERYYHEDSFTQVAVG